MFDTIKMDFGGAFGKRYCIPMFLEEMRHIPLELPSLRNSGFYIGGFNWFVDWVVFPLVYLGLWLFPNRSKGAMTALMSWGLKRFSRPPYGTLLKVESDGLEGGEHKEIDVITYHEDGYVFTAVPVVACLLQYLDGTAKKPGLWTQAIIVEPTRFMNDMERMGIDVKVQKRSLGSNEDQDR
jgi:saccharopine dehydrogenase (NAD+, L-lysine-forming)